jgi:hypothetical protein
MAHDRCLPAFAERNANNADLLAYARAWCRIEAGASEAIVELAKLARARGRISQAARLDVINLVSVGFDGAGAMKRLERLDLATADDFDLLAATFDALGMRGDAVTVSLHAVRLDVRPSLRARCERTLAWGAYDANTFAELQQANDIYDGACGRRAVAARCALERASDHKRKDIGALLIAVRECYNEFPDDNADERAWLLVTYFRWSDADVLTWISRARDASHAFGIHGAEELALAALDEAVIASGCDAPELAMVAAAATRIARSDHHRPELDSRIARLQGMTVERCAVLH